MTATPIKIISQPGVQRDGTRFASKSYLDAQWCRWQRGRPRKMGGYLSAAQNLPDKVYGISSFSANNTQYVHVAGETEIAQRLIQNGVLSGSTNRTPVGYVGGDVIGQFDVFFDINLGNLLIAHATRNLFDISESTDQAIFGGEVTDTAVLVATGQANVSGGILVVGNYLVSFGNDGFVQWSEANDVSVVLGSTNITQQKIIVGKRVRGGGVPAALLWSLDSLILMTYAPDPLVAAELWDFDIITDETSIMSSRSVIEYDGSFYWAGVDRFLMYNGVVREVPNPFNSNYFFDGLNIEQRQKVFAYKVPRFGEIWWAYPRGSALECTHAVVYNVREQTWYDTELPDGGRTDGIHAKVYNKPFMTGLEEGTDGYDLWQHETGVDRSRLGDDTAVPSHFETHEMNIIDADEKPDNKCLSIEFTEPDFVQAGTLKLTVKGRANARSENIDPVERDIPAVATGPEDQVVPMKESRRLMSFKFSSNVAGGNYEMGTVIGHVKPDDGRMTQ